MSRHNQISIFIVVLQSSKSLIKVAIRINCQLDQNFMLFVGSDLTTAFIAFLATIYNIIPIVAAWTTS